MTCGTTIIQYEFLMMWKKQNRCNGCLKDGLIFHSGQFHVRTCVCIYMWGVFFKSSIPEQVKTLEIEVFGNCRKKSKASWLQVCGEDGHICNVRQEDNLADENMTLVQVGQRIQSLWGIHFSLFTVWFCQKGARKNYIDCPTLFC